MSQTSELGGGSRCGLGFVTHQFFKPQSKKKELAGVAGLWYISFSKWKVRKIARIKLQEGKNLSQEYSRNRHCVCFSAQHMHVAHISSMRCVSACSARIASQLNCPQAPWCTKSVLERLFDDNVIRYFMFWKKESPQNNLWVPHSQEISEDVTRVRSASSILVTRPKVWALAPRATRALDEFS